MLRRVRSDTGSDAVVVTLPSGAIAAAENDYDFDLGKNAVVATVSSGSTADAEKNEEFDLGSYATVAAVSSGATVDAEINKEFGSCHDLLVATVSSCATEDTVHDEEFDLGKDALVAAAASGSTTDADNNDKFNPISHPVDKSSDPGNECKYVLGAPLTSRATATAAVEDNREFKLMLHPVHVTDPGNDVPVAPVTSIRAEEVVDFKSNWRPGRHATETRMVSVLKTVRIVVSAKDIRISTEARGTLVEIPLLFAVVGLGSDVHDGHPVISIMDAVGERALRNRLAQKDGCNRSTWLLSVDGGEEDARLAINWLGLRGVIRNDFHQEFEIGKTASELSTGGEPVRYRGRRPGLLHASPAADVDVPRTIAKMSADQEMGKARLERQATLREAPKEMLRETSMLVAVQSHPNISKLRGLFYGHRSQAEAEDEEELPRWLLVFDVGVRSLFEVISAERLLEPAGREVARGVLEALKHIHNLKIVHRKVCPDSVYVDGAWKATLSCFGSSRRCCDVAELTRVCGVPGYVAPEILLADERKCGCPIDMFSVGVMMYFVMCQKMPFQGSNTRLVVRRMKKGSVVFAAAVDASLISAMELIRSALCFDPYERPSASDALESAWLTAIDGRGLQELPRAPFVDWSLAAQTR